MITYEDKNLSVLLLMSLTTVRALSFQSSTLNSDIFEAGNTVKYYGTARVQDHADNRNLTKIINHAQILRK